MRTNDDLREAPRDPMSLVVFGVVASLIGGVLLTGGAAWGLIGGVLVVIGGVVGAVGIVAQGVRVGMRSAHHEEYLNRIIDEGREETA